MKFSLTEAQKYSNVDISSIPKEQIIKSIGAQLGAIEDVIDWSQKFEGAVIVKVVSCEKHPNADKLKICRIDDGGSNQQVERGDDGLVQVVCGAPNVKADMFTVWLAPGVVVPSSRDDDPFRLEARELRGVVSNGMLASAHELGISDDHYGIIDVDEEDAGKSLILGEALVNYYNLNDLIIDCENKMFTHRPDCFGNLGIAREVAAINGLSFISPDWYIDFNQPINNQESRAAVDGKDFEIRNEAVDLVPRFMAVTMSNVNVKPSPIWLQALLTRVGIKPINNVVDATNYVMHLTGQPLHAFDYDKFKSLSDNGEIYPRLSRPGEKITLLGQKEIELSGEEIVISTNQQAIALGGIMGGAKTEVDNETKNILIECATFDMYSIRRTSMRYGLFTDAVTRFNKGQSPLQNKVVLQFALKVMKQLSGADQASNVADSLDQNISLKSVDVKISYINDLLGTDLSEIEICDLLKRAEFNASVEGDIIRVVSPFWRMDVEHPEDVAEEVGRIYGFDKLPVKLPLRTSRPTRRNQLLDFKYEIRDKLIRSGANEVLTYSFVHGELLRKVGIDPDRWTYHIRNAISPDLQYYRPSITPSLLNKIHANIKSQAGSDNNQFAIFEIGRAHIKDFMDDTEQDLPKQIERLSLVVAADDKTAKTKQLGTAYYYAKQYLDFITNNQLRYEVLNNFESPLSAPFASGRSAEVFLGNESVGVIGEFNQLVSKKLKLPDFCAGFELDIVKLNGLLKERSYRPLSEFPLTKQDITVEASMAISYSDVETAISSHLITASSEGGYEFSLEPLSIFKPESLDIKNISFRLTIWHANRTLVSEEVSRLIESIPKNYN